MKKYLIASLLAVSLSAYSQKKQTLLSPDGKIKVEVSVNGLVSYTLIDNGDTLMRDSKLGLQLSGSKNTYRSGSVKRKTIEENINAPLYKLANYKEKANSMTITLNNEQQVEFRAFNNGMAYRFITKGKKGKYTVQNEISEFAFHNDTKAWLPYSTNEKNPKAMAFQATYHVTPLSEAKGIEAFLPATVECDGRKLTLIESDVESYPGMFIKASDGRLRSEFARYPKTFDYYPWRVQKYVTSCEDYIATCDGDKFFPWRIVAVSRKDTEMPVNTLAYSLASPSRVEGEQGWIKPGKVAWDWWNDWGISKVDFKSGINQQTYKYFIDFAAKNNLQYVVLDEGWYEPKSGDMLKVIPDLNLPELVKYAESKNIGIILWTVFNVLDSQLDAACEKYSKMGVKGFKVDFLDRYDQEGVEMIYRISDRCAKSKLLLDYHGIFPPNGINRTYPNILNFESVFGMEEAKWSEADKVDMPLYDVTYPFIRGMSGFVDFTPGGFRNATRKDFKPVYSNPMTMGTRCHQLANYIIDDSPLTMLADNPTIYEDEKECTDFITSLPTVFEKMECVAGELGEYIVMAREEKGDWYVAGQTNWTDRDITLDFAFLPSGKTFKAQLMCDGANADRVATDYTRKEMTVNSSTKLKIHMAPGGGFAMSLKK